MDKSKDIAAILWHSPPKQVSRNNNWRVRYAYLDSTGKQHETTETFSSATKRDRFVAYLDRQIKERKKPKKKSAPETKIETVADLLTAYAEVAKRKHTQGLADGWDEGTYKANMGLAKNYINPQLGELRIWEVTSADIRNAFDRIFDMPRALGNHKSSPGLVSQRTVLDCKKILSKAFGWAAEQEIIDVPTNPMLSVKLSIPKSDKRTMMSIELFKRVLECAKSKYYDFYILLLLMCTLSSRSGEIYGLRWSDVDTLGAKTIVHVNKALAMRSQEWIDSTRGKGIVQILGSPPSTKPSTTKVWVLKSTKTEVEKDRNVDYIYVDTDIATLLDDYKARQSETLRDAPYKTLGFIVCQKNGWPLSDKIVNKMFRTILAEVGCDNPKDYSIYCLRHFSITRKLEINGNNYVSLAVDTKHTEIETVIEYYQRPEDSIRQHTASALGDFLLNRGSALKPTDAEIEELIASAIDICNTDSDFRTQLAYMVKLARRDK